MASSSRSSDSADSATALIPLSCFLFRTGETKAADKWSSFLKISVSDTFLSLQKRFKIEGYGGFETRARGLGIQRVDYSICVKDKKSDPPDFPAGRIFSVNSEDEWEIFRGFVFADPKQFEIVGECFVLSDWSSESCFYLTRLEYF